METYLSARPGRGMTRQQVLDVLRAAGLVPKDDGVVSTSPVVMWEIGLDGDEYIICHERDGKVVTLVLESPSERLEKLVCRAFKKQGWEVGYE